MASASQENPLGGLFVAELGDLLYRRQGDSGRVGGDGNAGGAAVLRLDEILRCKTSGKETSSGVRPQSPEARKRGPHKRGGELKIENWKLKIMRTKHLFLLSLLACTIAAGQTVQQISNEELIAKFKPLPAPKVDRLTLKTNDRLAICGDSITEQRMYSRIIEDYLTMCEPELKVSVRQYGWSGEKAAGFLARMTNDCLEFKPTIATTCYGMNDHEYKPYEDRIGQTYEEKSEATLEAFKANGVRVIQGSPGCVGRVPGWAKTTNETVEDLNLSLCRLRNIGIELAAKEKEEFADVFWPMLTAEEAARAKYGPDYAISGKDGVHPGWAGHTVMAYAFLKAFGLDGEIGTFDVDLGKNRMKVSKGHKLVSANNGTFEITSSHYPFCACVPAGREAVSKEAK